jgi:hypothetical protein
MPVSRLRVISHNITKYRENETREQNYLLSIIPMQVYNTPLVSRIGTRPPTGAKVPIVDIFYVNGGRSQISSSSTSQGGPAVDVCYDDGGRS